MHRWHRIITTLLVLTAPIPGLAQTPDVQKTAEEQFYRGRDLARAGDCRRALGFFRTSQSLVPNRGKLLNTALCEEQVGRFADALRHFEEVLAQYPEDDERRALAKQRVEVLARRVARLRIEPMAEASSTMEVALDGNPVPRSTWRSAMSVDPGAHVVMVTAPGFLERRYEIVTEAGKILALSVSPGARAAPALSASVRSQGFEGRRRHIAGYTLAGVGFGGIGAGAVLGMLALAKHARVADSCPERVGCSRQSADEARSGKALAGASTAALGVGLAMVGAGTFLVLWRGPNGMPATAGIGPVPGGGGIRLGGRF